LPGNTTPRAPLGRHGRALACGVPESQASDALAPGVSDVNAVGSKIGALARPNKPDRGKSEGSAVVGRGVGRICSKVSRLSRIILA
jgi:hypothetical protein